MATPHSQTVISTRIENFRDAVYNDLTDQEKYCYEQSTDALLEDFQPKFQELSDAFDGWMDTSRQDAFRDFLNGLYAFLSLNAARALGKDTLINDSDAFELFNAGGLVGTILTQDETYFDDVVCYKEDPTDPTKLVQVECDTTDSTQTRKFPTLDDAISTVSGADENSQLSSLNSQYINIISRQIHIDLFEDPVIKGTPLSKDEIRVKIFEELHYLPIYKEFNIGLPLPSHYE